MQAVGGRLGFPDVWRDLTDLATLGTVADIVPLTAENRALVADGVRRMRTQPRVALAALAAVGGVTPDALSSDSVAFALAPRLNAAGRMADPQIALDLLMTDDPARAEELSAALDELNRVRQAAEADLAEAAIALAERIYHGERALVLAGEGWHEGVKGIVASRLTNRFGVPTILFTIEDGVALGSGRSVGTRRPVPGAGVVRGTSHALRRPRRGRRVRAAGRAARRVRRVPARLSRRAACRAVRDREARRCRGGALATSASSSARSSRSWSRSATATVRRFSPPAACS